MAHGTFLALLHLLLLLTVVGLGEAAYLGDDFSAMLVPGRLQVEGALVPTPPGPGKAWDGGFGWRSGMRHDPILETFYGRRDYVLYRPLSPGADFPVEEGTLEIWIRRDNAVPIRSISDNLIQFLDAEGSNLATIAIDYGEEGRGANLSLFKLETVWGGVLPLPTIAVGEYVHLAFTWGPNGGKDNAVYVNGRKLFNPVSDPPGNLAPLLTAMRGLRLGLGWEDSDPAFHTVIDEFAFSSEIKRQFDLTRTLFPRD